jgi:transmembrane sensor
MFVNDVTVASAAERLQRYHPAWISVPDLTLASRRVTGLYDLKNPDAALEAMVKPFGGKVHAVTSYGRVLTRF